MIIGAWRESLILFVGDIVALYLSLYLTLWLRHFELPTPATLAPHVIPFTCLFVLWALVFYSAGLYSKRLTLFPSRMSDALFKTQVANILFAALFFFVIPAFGIAPKTILALYLLISLLFLYVWRLGFFPLLFAHRTRERAVLAAEGEEAEELYREVQSNPRYGIDFFSRSLSEPDATFYVVSTDAPLETLARRGKQVVAFEDLYEEVFDRVPLSSLSSAWIREHARSRDGFFYVLAKRVIDLTGGVVMGLITLVALPLVYLAQRFEGPGAVFLRQQRFGQNGTVMTVYKFRTMLYDDSTSSEWIPEGRANHVTKVGAFLRQTSLDEFPQFINVLKGEISLIGPRSDILGLGQRLAEALPYYEARYLVVPGITGWAQINQQYEPGNVSPQSIEETKVRLAYDFYYLKHRSLGLDIVIALKTIKRMFFRVSSW
jgi:lipopolysaccharide/colanic/teichoic acid biosynthesis glycosyltransferase